MLLDQSGAGGKDRRKSQKQASDNRPESDRNHAGNHRYGPTESEPDQVLIPMSFAESRRVELNNHGGSNKIAERLNATADQTVKAAIVAAQDGIISLLSKRHTVQL